MCDQISDAVLDAHLEQDENAKVACGVLLIYILIYVCPDFTGEKSYKDYFFSYLKVILDLDYTLEHCY